MDYKELSAKNFNQMSELQLLQCIDAVFNIANTEEFNQQEHKAIMLRIVSATAKRKYKTAYEELCKIYPMATRSIAHEFEKQVSE